MSKSDAKYCSRFLDDAPGIRGDCEGRVKLGRPCTECPNRNIRLEVRDLRAERDAAVAHVARITGDDDWWANPWVPITIKDLNALRAERDALRKALKTARTCIAMELEGWIDSHGDTEGLYMAKVLPVIDAALAAQEPKT